MNENQNPSADVAEEPEVEGHAMSAGPYCQPYIDKTVLKVGNFVVKVPVKNKDCDKPPYVFVR